MPEKSKLFFNVRKALIREGWVVTEPHLKILAEDGAYEFDLSAEPVFFAEKGERKIAVLAKEMGSKRGIEKTVRRERFLKWLGFGNLTEAYGQKCIAAFQEAMGHCQIVQAVLAAGEPGRVLALVIPPMLETAFSDGESRQALEETGMSIIVFDDELGKIVNWLGGSR